MVEFFSGAGLEGMGINLSDIGNAFGGKKTEKRKASIAQARK